MHRCWITNTNHSFREYHDFTTPPIVMSDVEVLQDYSDRIRKTIIQCVMLAITKNGHLSALND